MYVVTYKDRQFLHDKLRSFECSNLADYVWIKSCCIYGLGHIINLVGTNTSFEGIE
jgi:hypothetical protein